MTLIPLVNVDVELKINVCSVDHASLFNLVIETNLVHSFSQCISSILFITSTCFGPLQVHHQEEQLYLCRMEFHTAYQTAVQNNKYQVSHKYSCSS